jgi:glycosyltransferase involved in cell wall biosynthesis
VADCIIATDRSLEDTVRRHLHPTPGQMRTIPNGIDLEAVRALAKRSDGERLRRDGGIGPDEMLFVSAGRIERNKGFDVLAAALGQLAVPGGPLAPVAWRWAIVGAGPAESSVRSAVAEAGLQSHVIWPGRATDAELHAWYEAATVFVHPTRYEGSSLVTLEAMAHRKPIIATRAGGLPDKVKPGVNGWLVEPDDPTALAGAIRSALDARGRFHDMGIHSLEIVERDFAWTRIVEQQIRVYEDLLR